MLEFTMHIILTFFCMRHEGPNLNCNVNPLEQRIVLSVECDRRAIQLENDITLAHGIH